ncbi:hypothetical protein TUM19329_35850 (plasmid) [Legionella antarctica]|uniref:Uncharacterized protein n=1 Tax=Legionella antarctica TaxID=2708020 RepID=A0A6F8T958_9GAMM|nr:hypothetical protein [Legionella antarctica]BCA97224.1 hypothetical protein TUM19329_35850 [Legionella antarctica]
MLTDKERKLAGALMETLRKAGITMARKLNEDAASVFFSIDSKYVDNFPFDIKESLQQYTFKANSGSFYTFTVPLKDELTVNMLINFCNIAITPPKETVNRKNRDYEQRLYSGGKGVISDTTYNHSFSAPEPSIDNLAWLDAKDKLGKKSIPETSNQAKNTLQFWSMLQNNRSEKPEVTDLKKLIGSSPFDKAGKGWFGVPIMPKHLKEMLRANTYKDIKNIAEKALKSDSPNKSEITKTLYEAIANSSTAENAIQLINTDIPQSSSFNI